MTACDEANRTVANSPVNFDNVFNAYFSLIQVATFKGWIRIIRDATDARVRYKFISISLNISNLKQTNIRTQNPRFLSSLNL